MCNSTVLVLCSSCLRHMRPFLGRFHKSLYLVQLSISGTKLKEPPGNKSQKTGQSYSSGIPRITFQDLIESMPTKSAAVLKAKGGPTMYLWGSHNYIWYNLIVLLSFRCCWIMTRNIIISSSNRANLSILQMGANFLKNLLLSNQMFPVIS